MSFWDEETTKRPKINWEVVFLIGLAVLITAFPIGLAVLLIMWAGDGGVNDLFFWLGSLVRSFLDGLGACRS